jgi:hypothetical protein
LGWWNGIIANYVFFSEAEHVHLWSCYKRNVKNKGIRSNLPGHQPRQFEYAVRIQPRSISDNSYISLFCTSSRSLWSSELKLKLEEVQTTGCVRCREAKWPQFYLPLFFGSDWSQIEDCLFLWGFSAASLLLWQREMIGAKHEERCLLLTIYSILFCFLV